MKKFFVSVCIVLFVLLCASCDTGETVVKWPEAPSFPAPDSVTVTSLSGGTAYKIDWDLVSGACDYQMFLNSKLYNQIYSIDYKLLTGQNISNHQTISSSDFYDLGFLVGSNNFRAGIRAISIDGTFSTITWSDYF